MRFALLGNLSGKPDQAKSVALRSEQSKA